MYFVYQNGFLEKTSQRNSSAQNLHQVQPPARALPVCPLASSCLLKRWRQRNPCILTFQTRKTFGLWMRLPPTIFERKAAKLCRLETSLRIFWNAQLTSHPQNSVSNKDAAYASLRKSFLPPLKRFPNKKNKTLCRPRRPRVASCLSRVDEALRQLTHVTRLLSLHLLQGICHVAPGRFVQVFH